MGLEQFKNTYTTALNGAISNSDTTIVVTGGPTTVTGSFRIKIENELIYVGSVSGTTFSNCTRGIEGTSAASHSDGTAVTHVLTAGGLQYVPKGLIIGDVIPTTPGSNDQEWESTPDTLPTDWAWVSAAPTFTINSDFPSWFVIERSDTTERKIRKSNFTMAATSGLWIKFGGGGRASIAGQFEWIIYDSASSDGYGFGIHNGNVAIARDSNGGSLANRGSSTSEAIRGNAIYMGVMRVSDTWQTWFSMNGINWFEIQSADTRAFTVARLELRWSTDSTPKQRGIVDWIRYRTDNNFPKP